MLEAPPDFDAFFAIDPNALNLMQCVHHPDDESAFERHTYIQVPQSSWSSNQLPSKAYVESHFTIRDQEDIFQRLNIGRTKSAKRSLQQLTRKVP